MFRALGRFCVHRRWSILVAYAVLVPLAAVIGAPAVRMLRIGGFEDWSADSWQVDRALVEELGVGAPDILPIYTVKSGGNVDDIEILTGILGVIDQVKRDPSVVRVTSYYEHGATQLVSRDRTRTFLVINLRGDDQSKGEALERLRPLLAVEGTEQLLAGYVPVNQALYLNVEEDLHHAEMLAFPITALLLLLIFGSGASASLPLILGGLAVVFAFFAMRVLAMVTDISIFAANVVTVLGLGLGIDYSLFLVARYREELARPPAPGDPVARHIARAVEQTVATTGRAVAFSGLTVAASLCGLLLFPQMHLRSIAYGGIAVVSGAMVLALTLLPALLAIFGTRVDALRLPFSLSRPPKDEEHGFWHRVAFAVMRRPVLVAVAVTVPLVALAAPYLRVNNSIADHRILPPESEPRIATDVLDAEFLPHQVTAHEVIVRVPGDALGRDNLELLYAVHEHIRAIPGITAVQSLFAPAETVGKERVLALLAKPKPEQDPNVLAGLELFTRGGVMRFAAVSAHVFNDQGALDQVLALRALAPPPGGSIQVGGIAAVLWDMQECFRRITPWMVAFVALIMFVVLFVVFGSVTLPLKAMVMNSLSLTASFGAIVWVFQDGRFAELLDYSPLGISDATQPLLMFAVVFGLSMDYEVLLLTRVREEFLRTGDNALSVARGLARTGRLITSAALLLVVVIGAFATSKILFMKTLGVGMALAIALDATVIRALLVPATMRLMGAWNWWAPAPLTRLWKRAGLSDLEE
ncbi:MAG: hypothetical protein A2138_18500 [Deltaproteobacteria bacterium RBG_16_71_12]|nr:MAG: hypothetical protein A2138_18500 [Deltaproteobacteria bacterium RBG_16_71_12]